MGQGQAVAARTLEMVEQTLGKWGSGMMDFGPYVHSGERYIDVEIRSWAAPALRKNSVRRT